MPTIQIKPGDTLKAIAGDIFGGDSSRWREIADLNPNLDIMKALPANISINIPDASQILNFAEPKLTAIAETVTKAESYLKQGENFIKKYESYLPSNLQGYAKEALGVIGKLNGVLGKAESTLTNLPKQIRNYLQPTKLVDWLLHGNQVGGIAGKILGSITTVDGTAAKSEASTVPMTQSIKGKAN